MEQFMVVLMPENGSFEGSRTITVSQPVSFGRQLENQDQQSANFVRFNSKVVSRQHCKISMAEGKFYLQDTKSSSGTFLNGERLSPQNQTSQPRQLRDGDIVKLGEDFQQDNVQHKAICFKVRLPSGTAEGGNEGGLGEDAYVDLAMDSEVRANVDDEFNTIWNSLVADINAPLKRLRAMAQASKDASALQQQNTPNKTPSYSTPPLRNDNTVTLIKKPSQGDPSFTSTTSTLHAASGNSSPSTPVVSKDGGAQECVELIESLTWESNDVKQSLIELARKQDQQLIAFYRSLKGFPSSFINVATKYVKVAKQPKK